MVGKPGRIHLLGLLAVIVASVSLLLTLVPYLARVLFTPPLRGYNGIRFELFYYSALALIPAALWLVPALLRRLARAAFAVHRSFFGRSGFYVRFPTEKSLRFRTTVLMSLGPFAVDLLAIVEVDHFFGNLGRVGVNRGFLCRRHSCSWRP